MVYTLSVHFSRFFVSQIYRAQWNDTACRKSWPSQTSCGKWVPRWEQCNGVCISVGYTQLPLPISSCAHIKVDYSKVYTVDVNLTVGYNLIVIPEKQRFTTRRGDIVGLHRNTSDAVLQRIIAERTRGVYYIPGKQTPELRVDLKSMIASNFSFRIKVHALIQAHTKFTVSCLRDVGTFPLMAKFYNPIPTYNNTAALEFQSILTVQNKIPVIKPKSELIIAVNRSKMITAKVSTGTNITCVWSMPNSNLSETHSPHLEQNTTTEGITCQINFSSPQPSYIPITLNMFNLVSKRYKTVHVQVRKIIRGLKVEMCHSSFAYDNARTCYNSSVTSGTEVSCTWYFSQNDNIAKQIGQNIRHELTPVGVRNFTLYCKNKLPEIMQVIFPVKVITNPLSIEAPSRVPTFTTVKITCQVNWPNGPPANFFKQWGLTGKKGTEIVAAPILTVRARGIRKSSNGSVTIQKRYTKSGKHKVYCEADNYPDLNTFHMITTVYPITGVNVTTECSLRIKVGTKCRFQAHFLPRLSSPSVSWTVTEVNGHVTVHVGRRTIDHQFANIGVANVSVNVSNDVSSGLKAVHIFVYSLSSWGPPLSKSSTIHFLQSATNATPSLTSYSSHSSRTSQTSHTSYTSSTKYPSVISTSSSPHVVASLKDAELLHAPRGLVGEPIAFSVAHVEKAHLFRFAWNWNDQSPLEDAGKSSTHIFIAPGQYNISVNISSGVSQVVLSGLVTVQYAPTKLHIRDIALGLSNLLILEFEILQGNNVTYLVDFGDYSGK